MIDESKYEVLRQFADDKELITALETGTLEDKRQALLNVSYGNGNGEVVFDLFLNYVNDPDLKFTAYLCIHIYLETCRSYPLAKILPTIIHGLNHKEQSIQRDCQSALENLVSPGKNTGEDLNFNSFQISFDNTLVSEYLNSFEEEKIIIAILYIFYQPHKDDELFDILMPQLAKKIKSVNCVVGQIIDTKLWRVIELINGLEEISVASYKTAINIGIGGKAIWVYDRFDEMQELANRQMKTLKPNTDDRNNG